MRVSLIVAMDREGGIAKNGRLPWRLRSDMQRFKALTMGHHLIVGRKTWESIGRPLAGRKMVIISRRREYSPQDCPDCALTSSLDAALALARLGGEDEVFIGGGAQIYALALPVTDRIYLTEVDVEAGCDVFFPSLDWGAWREVEQHASGADEHNQHDAIYRVLERIHRS